MAFGGVGTSIDAFVGRKMAEVDCGGDIGGSGKCGGVGGFCMVESKGRRNRSEFWTAKFSSRIFASNVASVAGGAG